MRLRHLSCGVFDQGQEPEGFRSPGFGAEAFFQFDLVPKAIGSLALQISDSGFPVGRGGVETICFWADEKFEEKPKSDIIRKSEKAFGLGRMKKHLGDAFLDRSPHEIFHQDSETAWQMFFHTQNQYEIFRK